MVSISAIITSIGEYNLETPTLKTIRQCVLEYLDTVKMARSKNTYVTYRNGMNYFQQVLAVHHLEIETSPIIDLTEEAVIWFTASLKVYSASTERLYLTAVNGFYDYLAAENLTQVNLPRIQMIIRQRARKPGQRLPQFPVDQIEQIIETMLHLTEKSYSNENEHLRDLRDRSFLLTLADTGLRVHEACNLHRGDIDWNEGQAIIIGKGNRQDVVRFSSRSMIAMKEYLHKRSPIDGNSSRPLPSLPLFARHDKGSWDKIRPMTTTTGRNIVAEWVENILGKEAVGTITPHSFRHYFVTKVLRSSGNLKLAQELARHRNITVTQRYAHLSNDELDKGYYQAIEENNKK
jgi:integrase/recombinase XerC